mmetsp:Transcript_39723/g.73231  ORF Transcript_39723/g.73231 Transcript_39723/m.73231 type:complete len:201 (-) Transcript_39723:272-874(-)
MYMSKPGSQRRWTQRGSSSTGCSTFMFDKPSDQLFKLTADPYLSLRYCIILSCLLANLNDILIHKDVVLSAPLRLVLGRPPPDKGVRKFIDESSVQPVAELFDGGVSLRMQNDRFLVIRDLSLWLRVDSEHVATRPNLLHQLLQIPLMLRRYRNIIRHLVQNVKLLNCKGIDFVEHVEDRDVRPVPLDYVDELINRDVFP